MKLTGKFFCVCSLLVVAACTAAPQAGVSTRSASSAAASTAAKAVSQEAGRVSEVTRLAQEIQALGPDVDPQEATRAAQIAFGYTRQLAQEYQITDPPIVHNSKVNMGLRPRGLCWHWAHDIEKRLKQERFVTLELHRAIAPPKNAFRLEHSTAIISRRGDTMYDGIVLDPWRKGGELTWVKTQEDPRYDWRPRAEVLAQKLGAETAGQLLAQAGASDG